MGAEILLASLAGGFVATYILDNLGAVDFLHHASKKKTAQPKCLSGDSACAARTTAANQKRNTLSGTNPKTGKVSTTAKPVKSNVHPLSHIVPGLGKSSSSKSSAPSSKSSSSSKPITQAQQNARILGLNPDGSKASPAQQGFGSSAPSRPTARTGQKTPTVSHAARTQIQNDNNACAGGNDQSACDRVAAQQDRANRQTKSSGGGGGSNPTGIPGCEGLSAGDCQKAIIARSGGPSGG